MPQDEIAVPQPSSAGLGGWSAVAEARAKRIAWRAGRAAPKPLDLPADESAEAREATLSEPPRQRRWVPMRGTAGVNASHTDDDASATPAALAPPPEAAADPASPIADAQDGAEPAVDASVFAQMLQAASELPSPPPAIAPPPEAPLVTMLLPETDLVRYNLPIAHPVEVVDASPIPIEPPPAPAPSIEPPPAAAAPPAAPSVPPDEPIIAELGPGMRLRLRQIGYDSELAMANADPLTLRQSLGEISRLLNVEAWIEAARRRIGGHHQG